MKKSQNHGKSSLNRELLHLTLARIRSTMGAHYKEKVGQGDQEKTQGNKDGERRVEE